MKEAGKQAEADVEGGARYSIVKCADCAANARAVRVQKDNSIVVALSSMTDCRGGVTKIWRQGSGESYK